MWTGGFGGCQVFLQWEVCLSGIGAADFCKFVMSACMSPCERSPGLNIALVINEGRSPYLPHCKSIDLRPVHLDDKESR